MTITSGISGQSIGERQQLLNIVQRASSEARHKAGPVLASITERSWPMDAISLFERASAFTADRFFWSQPGEGFTLVGLGIAHAIEAVEEPRFRQAGASWRHLLNGAILEGPCGLPGAGPLLFGGFAFDPDRRKSALWQGYPDGRLILPRLMLTIRGGEAWLTCNILVEPDSDPVSEAEMLVSQCDEWFSEGMAYKEQLRATVLSIKEMRPASEWKDEVARTAKDIADGKLEKAVLARAVCLEADRAFDVSGALARLVECYTDCYIFAVATGERCFISATPERLAQVRDGVVKTMSLAGSIRRGTTPEEDHKLGAALLTSAKDHHEHELVVRALVEALNELCEHLEVGSQPSLLKLGNVQHLCTPVIGRLSGDSTLLDVIGRLHPTPAVGGRPRDIAVKLIRDREGFDRGWYAGPVGWIDQNGEGEFAVALRSALLHGTEATLFAGCGIVADSNPEREYAESILKLKPMLSALAAE